MHGGANAVKSPGVYSGGSPSRISRTISRARTSFSGSTKALQTPSWRSSRHGMRSFSAIATPLETSSPKFASRTTELTGE